jgi:hypothetical protein
MRLSWESSQYQEAFKKLQRAHQLEIEAIEQFHTAREESIANDNGLNDDKAVMPDTDMDARVKSKNSTPIDI